MGHPKGLWLRLRSLEDEYRALSCSDPVDARTEEAPWRVPVPVAVEAAPGRATHLRKEIDALRTRFGLEALPDGPGVRDMPRVVAHALPEGKVHPVTPADVHRALATVPERHLVGLRRVLLTDSRRDRHASYGTCQVRLCYPVDRDRCVRLRRYESPWEVARFGARLHEDEDGRYVQWTPAALRNYVVRHLLMHEIGHHVAWLRGLAVAVTATRREEEFAEQYAHAAFDPERD